MFLQVKIRPEDQQSLRFLWRENPTDPEPKTYCMTSLVFGASSSPCTALYVKNKNAQAYINEYPDAVDAIIRKHYMDDYLDSVDTSEQAKRLIQQVIHIHRQGGFQLCGWACNDESVLEGIQCDTWTSTMVKLSSDRSVERVLGCNWNYKDDTIVFDVNLAKIPTPIINGGRIPTKREMLRVVMSLFDPQGFLAPFTIRGRMLLQEVWQSGIAWDDRLPDAEFEKWRNWTSELGLLDQCIIPRCYIDYTHKLVDMELHTFCDASEKAYAAVSYWRTRYADGHIRVSFIASKSRVAPLKPISIPRLELQAALLGSRLARYIGEEHDYRVSRRLFWTDSQTVLNWIKSDPHCYKAFVSHRLGEIDELTDIGEWKWVPTAHNPADDATRDAPNALDSSSRWFQGPEFLKTEKHEWPPVRPQTEQADATAERKAQPVIVCTSANSPSLPDINRYSSWNRLLRSTACVYYAIDTFKREPRTGITISHLSKAEAKWCKQVQRDSFSKEIQALQQGNQLPRDTRLRRLTPIIDDTGMLRITGRTGAAEGLAASAKNPAILDGRHPYTRLLVEHYHQQAGHGSTEMVINEIRQRYWITNLRPTARSVATRCMQCRIRRAQPQAPRMGDLPVSRVAHHHRPFTHTGIDYFGPMEVTVGRRREKRWAALFTCLTTRAVHIELAPSLSTDSAIMALRRMIARRGCPTVIYSDNGTNLVGANAELKRALQELSGERMSQYAINRGIDWRFIPPAAPHMGGSWEILVKCVKNCLKTILKQRAPREETLMTFLAEAEHSVNARPLTHVSVDPRDPEALTPNHFIIGTSSGYPIPGHFTNTDLNCRKQWRIAQRLADMFWSRWVREYAPTLNTRQKWNEESVPLKVGDVVIILDHTLPRNVWPKGIVVKTHPGPDGRIRVADVKTQKGIFKRPTVKLVRLPVREEGAGEE